LERSVPFAAFLVLSPLWLILIFNPFFFPPPPPFGELVQKPTIFGATFRSNPTSKVAFHGTPPPPPPPPQSFDTPDTHCTPLFLHCEGLSFSGMRVVGRTFNPGFKFPSCFYPLAKLLYNVFSPVSKPPTSPPHSYSSFLNSWKPFDPVLPIYKGTLWRLPLTPPNFQTGFLTPQTRILNFFSTFMVYRHLFTMEPPRFVTQSVIVFFFFL